MKKPLHQTFFERITWILAGFLALGTVFDAVSNAITLITLPIAIAGTVLVAMGLVSVQLALKHYPIQWVTKTGSLVKISRLGLRSTLPFLGMVLLLWLPLPFARQRSLADDVPFDAFELVIELPSEYADNIPDSGDYAAVSQTLCAGQSDCDVAVEVQFISGRFSFRESLYFTSGLNDLRVYIVPCNDENWVRPPTWYSYVFYRNDQFSGPVALSRRQGDRMSLSIKAWRHDLAQLGPEVTMRSIEGWDVVMQVTWTGPDSNQIYTMMDEERALEWIREFPAIIKMNAVVAWRGVLSQNRSHFVHVMPHKVDRGEAEVWTFTKSYMADPSLPSSHE